MTETACTTVVAWVTVAWGKYPWGCDCTDTHAATRALLWAVGEAGTGVCVGVVGVCGCGCVWGVVCVGVCVVCGVCVRVVCVCVRVVCVCVCVWDIVVGVGARGGAQTAHAPRTRP